MNYIKRTATINTLKKYRWESHIFIFFSLLLIWIEFFPSLHFKTDFSIEMCNKINNIISQLCLAYVASYIFLCVNVMNREQKNKALIYPHIIRILKDIFFATASHHGLLIFLSKHIKSNETFTYSIDEILEILSALKKDNTPPNDKLNLSTMLCNNSIEMAKKISYDIELLNNFSDLFESKYNSLLYTISQNYFILQLKNKDEITITDYQRLILQNIELYKTIELLREESEKIFKIEFP